MDYGITFSTWLTLFRIGLSPCVMVAIFNQTWFVAIFLFIIAALTDFFDGFFARLYNQETQLGKILDPIADKILLFSTLLSLFLVCKKSVIPLWFVLLFTIKEIILIFGAYFLLRYKQSIIFNPSWCSKWVTALLMVFFVYCMLMHTRFITINATEPLLIFFAISTVLIMLDYSYQFYIRLKE